MGIKPSYDHLPFDWHNESNQTGKDDRDWLESIIRNAAPGSDWWIKTRIVQLAYRTPVATITQTIDELPIYAGLTSAIEIAETLRDRYDLTQSPVLAAQLNEEYVVKTLNSWHDRQFSQAISRNFEVYASRNHHNIFLVTSTASISRNIDRQLPPLSQWRPLFNINELAQIIQESSGEELTLRTHGYGTPAPEFYHNFAQEADELNLPSSNPSNTLKSEHFLIGYCWPSEQPITSPSLWIDIFQNWGIIFKFLFILSGIAGIAGTGLFIFLKLLAIPLLIWMGSWAGISQIWAWTEFAQVAVYAVRWYWIVPTLFMFWGLLFQLLRLTVYQRDRYRAIHYGSPDLAEFFWRLDHQINRNKTPASSTIPIIVNLVGHSMGCLTIIDALRVLSDRFGKDDSPETASQIGDNLQLDQLILVAPDIPLEFIRDGRNNYVHSAINRCQNLYLMSSDRDIVLRYLSTFANWSTEPSLDMSGLRLGNIYLQPTTTETVPHQYTPLVRNIIHSQPIVSPTSGLELFEQFNYIDCSEMPEVGQVSWQLNSSNGIIIDLINIAFFFAGKIDVHGGYFLTKTPAFAIVKFLLTMTALTPEQTATEIQQLITHTPIRFLPALKN